MFVRICLVLCLSLLLNAACQSEHSNLMDDDIDLASGDVVAEPDVAFTDEPAYDAVDGSKLTFKIEAANEAAVKFVYAFMHGSNLNCKNASDWESGNFNISIELTDSHDYGERLVCIRGVDTQGKMSAKVIPFAFKKEEPDIGNSSVEVLPTISINGTQTMMTVAKAQNSVANKFKWCVQSASIDCPQPEQNQYNDTQDCTFTDGQLDTDIDISAAVDNAGDGDLIACVVGSDGTNHKLAKTDTFAKGTAPAPKPKPQPSPEELSSQPNKGILMASSKSIGHHTMGRSYCHSFPQFKNTGTDTIKVEFTYDNDQGLNLERRQNMFSDMIYQVYPLANHTQVSEQLFNSYCRNGQLDADKIINSGDTLDLPPGHQVMTVFKAKDPTSTNHDVKYFNKNGYACIQMKLRDLNNKKEIIKYRCLRRAELSLYSRSYDKDKNEQLTKIEKETSGEHQGEYVVELSLSENRHPKFTVVNAIVAEAVAARSTETSKDYVRKHYPHDLRWYLVGYKGEPVPAWLYFFGENFSRTKDGVKEVLSAEDQFQVGIRKSKIDAGHVASPKAGDSYRLMLLSNSLSDETCKEVPINYVTKHISATGETRKDKNKKLDFCPRADVLNIKIIQ